MQESMFRDRQAMAYCAPRPHERGESVITAIVVMERYELEHMPSLMQILSVGCRAGVIPKVLRSLVLTP